jgi:hypothetical protein
VQVKAADVFWGWVAQESIEDGCSCQEVGRREARASRLDLRSPVASLILENGFKTTFHKTLAHYTSKFAEFSAEFISVAGRYRTPTLKNRQRLDCRSFRNLIGNEAKPAERLCGRPQARFAAALGAPARA